MHCDRPGAQPARICSVSKAHGTAPFTPTAAHKGCRDNPDQAENGEGEKVAEAGGGYMKAKDKRHARRFRIRT